MSDASKDGVEFARDLQVKFELYFTGLIFTLLALSIQTAAFTHNPLQNSFELAGWAALLIAGLAGLSRLEWMPTIHDMYARVSEAEDELATWESAVATDREVVNRKMEPLDAAVRIPKLQAHIKKFSAIHKTLGRYSSRKHQTRKWTFLVGLCFVIASRACEPVSTIATSFK